MCSEHSSKSFRVRKRVDERYILADMADKILIGLIGQVGVLNSKRSQSRCQGRKMRNGRQKEIKQLLCVRDNSIILSHTRLSTLKTADGSLEGSSMTKETIETGETFLQRSNNLFDMSVFQSTIVVLHVLHNIARGEEHHGTL